MRDFVKKIFSESGEASWSRVGSFLALIAGVAWVGWIVYWTRALPALDGLTFFIGTLYGLGKAGETAQRILGGGGRQ